VHGSRQGLSLRGPGRAGEPTDDFGVNEWHGTNAFIREGENVFRTCLINSRVDEAMGSTWAYLDITALGRQEEWEGSPEGYPQAPPYEWWNYHDARDRAPSILPVGCARLRTHPEGAA
jgi:predicted dithiol-disulfide oxidoreductase (DUF899 family)